MFLATTANQNYWDKNEKILFLGEWCKLYHEKNSWENLDYETLPYPWEDRDLLNKSFNYIEKLYDKYILAMSKTLNHIHNCNYTQKYWQVVVGLWLRNLMDVTYERYVCLKSAYATGKVSYTWICDTKKMPPKHRVSYAFDDYNLYLYSCIIEELNLFPYKKKPNVQGETKPSGGEPKSTKYFISELKRQLKKSFKTFIRQAFAVLLIEYYPKLAMRFGSKYVFVGSLYLNFIDQIKLQLSLKQVPYLYQGKKILFRNTVIDHDLRSKITLPKPENEYEKILNRFILNELPCIYVENYKSFSKKSIKLGPKNPKVILTAFSINYRECFEMWAAHYIEHNKTKLLLSQHGGGYGVALHSSVESHFLKTFDYYYTWGSRLNKHSKVKPMPAFRLWSFKSQVKKVKKNGDILIVATTMPRYKVFLESGIAGSHMVEYIHQQKRFLVSLDTSALSRLKWRYFNNLWNEVEQLHDQFPYLTLQHGLKKQLGKKSDFVKAVKNACLVVHTANETTYLETLGTNIPTVMFWDPNYYQVRPELVSYFDLLVEANILFYDPQAAAEHINRIHTDPCAWWDSTTVQKARQLFCRQLAITLPEWKTVWKGELKKVINND